MINMRRNSIVTRLIRACGSHSSTESLLSYVIDNGMLDVCTWLVDQIKNDKRRTISWLRVLCDKEQVGQQRFINEIKQVVCVFQRVSPAADHYATLGLPPEAPMAEVKQAYRKLCRKYHPDTAGSRDDHTKERFIAVTCAYNDILLYRSLNLKQQPVFFPKWRTGKGRGFRREKLKKDIYWLLFISGGLVFFSVVLATMYNERQKFAGLQNQPAGLVRHTGEEAPARADESHVEEGAPVFDNK